MDLFFLLAPIIVSVIVLVYALVKGFNKTAFYFSAAVSMVAAMFIMRYSGTWYGFFCALTIPMAVTYVIICFILSLKEDKNSDKK